MRIALVHSFYDAAVPSGENESVQMHAAALRKAGAEVRIFERRTDEARSEALYGLRAGLRVATGRGASPEAAIDRFDPHVVHVHNLFPNFGDSWTRRMQVPVVATFHNYRFGCANGLALLDGQQCYRCLDGNPLHGLKNRCYRDSYMATLPLAIQQTRRRRGRMLGEISHLVFLSELTAERFRTWYSNVAPPISVWPNFSASATVSPEGRCRSGWLFVGRLSPEKGILPLTEAWPPSAGHLTIVGSGPQAPAVIELVASRPNISYIGPAERDDILRLMRGSIGLVVPSVCQEQFPLVYAEALSAGCTVVSDRNNSVAKLTARDQIGAAYESLADLPAALSAAQETTPAQAIAVYESKYTEAAFAQRALNLYESLIKRQGQSERDEWPR